MAYKLPHISNRVKLTKDFDSFYQRLLGKCILQRFVCKRTYMYEQNNIHIFHCTLIKKVISTDTLVPTVIQVANNLLSINHTKIYENTICQPNSWLQNITVTAFIINFVGEIFMYVNNVVEKRFKLCPFNFSNSRQGRCSGPVEMPHTCSSPFSWHFTALFVSQFDTKFLYLYDIISLH